jgi:cobalt-precorrin-5B (C1)-methyltransferase
MPDQEHEAPPGGAPDRDAKPKGELRKGWTTGACAAAAARAAYEALLTGRFPDPVSILLPRGQRPSFALAQRALGEGRATAGIVKDAGDDPDVTHGALILTTVEHGPAGGGIVFRAGQGVGTVTRPGLQLPPGEPSINPGPRGMIARAIHDAADECGGSGDVIVTVAVPGGEALAEKTLNARLGIIGGISILGTTGIVVPFSCAAWIHSIHRGIDVARAAGLTHVAAATGSTSEAAIKAMYELPDMALLDMGDFAGGTLKYLREHPVPRVTIAGGFGKLTKLAAGHLDLHSSRSSVDVGQLADLLAELDAPPTLIERARAARSAGEVLEMTSGTGLNLPDLVAQRARSTALAALAGGIALDVVIFDRQGRKIGQAGP